MLNLTILCGSSLDQLQCSFLYIRFPRESAEGRFDVPTSESSLLSSESVAIKRQQKHFTDSIVHMLYGKLHYYLRQNLLEHNRHRLSFSSEVGSGTTRKVVQTIRIKVINQKINITGKFFKLFIHYRSNAAQARIKSVGNDRK